MNQLIAKVMGSLNENDVVPVLASLPSRTYRERQQRSTASQPPSKKSDVKRVMGEAQGDVIPKGAEEIEGTGAGNFTAKLRPIKDVVQEPSYPTGEKEQYMTPYTALTAPDITPKAMTPVDPSKLPGVQTTRFTSPALTAQGEEQKPEIPAPDAGADNATRTMDTLLGRRRTGAPARNGHEFAQAGQVATAESITRPAPPVDESQALTMLGLVDKDALLGQNKEMPPPTQSDGKTVFAAARRFF